MKARQNVFRGIIYTIGMLSLALGIILNTKSGLGVAPIVTVSFTVSEITGLNFSNLTLCLYSSFAIAEFFIKGKSFRLYDLLQIPLSIAFTRCMNFYANAIDLQPELLWQQVLTTVVACTFTAVGLALSVSMRLVPNPSDGIVQAIADRSGKNLGLIKNVFDGCCIASAIILGLVFRGSIIGIGLGTVIALFLTGRIVYLFNRFCISPFVKLAFGEVKT